MAQILGDTDNKRALYEALTRYNYFPNQRASVGELPPCIDTRQFTPEVVEALAAIEEHKDRRKSGYDLVSYKSTRYNNVPRVLGIVHPKAYSLLAKCIHDNWTKLESITTNKSSIIKPEFHPEEKRLMVMNYEEALSKASRAHQNSFAKRFIVRTDIANCFNSIYSHAIAWAAVGITEAKAQQKDTKLWFNQLDMFQRKTKRNETQGIPIGSATSSIVTELILSRIDGKLREQGFEFDRYVDDYTCYCKTDVQAHDFLNVLGTLLSDYKLSLNLRKTDIESLPSAIEDSWVLELRGALPSRLNHAGEGEPKLSINEALSFLNRAIDVNKITPDGSVLKYAVSLIIAHLDEMAPYYIVEPLLNLAWHYPVLLPLLDLVLKNNKIDSNLYRSQLLEIIKDNAEKGRSDGMAWPLHTLKMYGATIDEDTANKIILSKDCLAITLLFEMDLYERKVVEFAVAIIKSSDNYEKDTYWLLLYQLYFKGLIPDPYGDGVFECLKSFDVNFVPGDRKSDAEKRCDEIQQQITSECIKHRFSAVLPINTKNEKQPDDDSHVF
jgi:hypothetical protein